MMVAMTQNLLHDFSVVDDVDDGCWCRRCCWLH